MADALQDPNYLAYMRALGFESAEAERIAAGGVQRAENRQAFEAPRIQEEGLRQRENVAYSAEDRGVLQSGSYLKQNAQALGDEQYRLGALTMGTAEGIGDIESELARQLASIRRQGTERLLDTGSAQYLSEGLAPYQGG